MTVSELITNITKGQTAISVKHILSGLMAEYNQIKGSIRFNGIEKGDFTTTVYVLVPSSKPSIFYDVVLEIKSTGKFTNEDEIKVFSNSPSFAFNFAYVFNQANALLLTQKYGKEFKLIPPKTRNPFGLFGFDKSLFCGIQFIKEAGLDNLRNSYNQKIPYVKSFSEKEAEVMEYEKKKKLKRSR